MNKKKGIANNDLVKSQEFVFWDERRESSEASSKELD